MVYIVKILWHTFFFWVVDGGKGGMEQLEVGCLSSGKGVKASDQEG